MKQRGFNLIELMIVVAIIGILATIAVPSYQSHIVTASREAAQTELMQMAAMQERIYLNSNAYTTSITGAYNGQSTGGMGWAANTKDGKYTFSCANCVANSFTIAATPVAGSTQASNGTLSINSTGQRLWTGGSKPTW